jgi:hypothetical protein
VSTLQPARPRRQRRRRAPWRLAGPVLLGLLAAAIFALGVAVGQALNDNPRDGGTRTFVRTLRPLPLSAETPTVTVTVTEDGTPD